VKLGFAFCAVIALAVSPLDAAKPKLSANPEDLAVQAVHNYAACIADTTPKGAEELLALDYGSSAYHKKLQALGKGHADGRCMAGNMIRSSQALLAGGMAERLLVKHSDRARFTAAVAADGDKPLVGAHDPLEDAAVCVIRADPAGSWAVLATDPTSDAELAALKAVSPSLPKCVPTGRKVVLNRPGLRAVLALAAYHMTQPASPAQGS
jgi:hypothetical protein